MYVGTYVGYVRKYVCMYVLCTLCGWMHASLYASRASYVCKMSQ